MSKRLNFTIALFIFSVVALLLFALIEQDSIERDVRAKHLKAGDFELLYDGKPLKLSDLRGSPIILYFGYTFCPDVCPVGLSKIREALLSNEGFKDVPVLFITVDPERDTAERLKEYTSFFHSNILGLTGSVEQVGAVSAAYGTFFKSGKAENPLEYTVDHSAYVYLLDSQGKLMRVLDHDVNSAQISELLHKLL